MNEKRAAVTIEPSLRLALKTIVQKAEVKFSSEAILEEFGPHKANDQNLIRKLFQVLKKLLKNNPEANRTFEEVSNNFDKATGRPFDGLLMFLRSYVEATQAKDSRKSITDLGKIANNLMGKFGSSSSNGGQVVEMPGANLSSDTTSLSVMDVRKRVVEATGGGLVRSASILGLATSTPFASRTANTKIGRNSSFWNFNHIDSIYFQTLNVTATPTSSQEKIILGEVLYCLMGMRTTHITPEPASCEGFQPIKFQVSEEIQISLRDIVTEILSLASHYSLVQKFIAHIDSLPSCGQVLQALSATLRDLITDYYMVITQLESEQHLGSLTLHKVLFYLRSTMCTMQVLAETLTAIYRSESTGGRVLTLLFDKITSLTGDLNSQQLIIHLTEAAAAPYIEILELWILKGVIIDKQQEFLIEDNEIIRREEIETNHYSASYWEKRYTIRRDRTPCFLENVSDVILRTGKYLNVIRQCGNYVVPPLNKPLRFSAVNQEHLQTIKNAYDFASKTLLELLVTDKDLIGHLVSVKRYLLLHQGDFITQFMDASEDELSKNVETILPMKLDNLLGLTLRTSSAKHDPFKDGLHCDLFTFDLVKQMSIIHLAGSKKEYYTNNFTDDDIGLLGYECFAFRYEVEWPVSLILNQYSLSEYQMIFRQLFHLKYVERLLWRAWVDNKNILKFAPQSGELYRFTFSVRQRMMYVIQNIEYYMMVEVIEPMWHEFIMKMDNVENVDDVLLVHEHFIDACMQNCMLKNPELLQGIIGLCKICLEFCKLIGSESNPPSAKYLEQIKQFDKEFSALLIELLKDINLLYHKNPIGKFMNLIHRINFNSFYTDKLENCAQNTTDTVSQ